MDRRDFLKTTVLAGSAIVLPSAVIASPAPPAALRPRRSKPRPRWKEVLRGKLDDFMHAYIEAGLWASPYDDANGERPLGDDYSWCDLSAEALEVVICDCAKFQRENAVDLHCEAYISGNPAIEMAGHDFWLTRNGHGCGFWSGDWPKEVGERLTKASEAFHDCFFYVGDDGLIYAQ